MAASGSLVKWYVAGILGKSTEKPDLAALDEAASQIPAGSDGVTVLPYFLGEKTPILDPHARGVVFGLDLSHGRAHIFRAILEAVIYGFRHHVDVLTEAGLTPKRFVATNGGVSSRLWRQIAADGLGQPIVSFQGHTGSSLGVAFLAGKATGLFADWSDINRFLRDAKVNEPDPATAQAYQQGYMVYRELYQRLQDLFPQLTET
jgi:xylulokinase